MHDLLRYMYSPTQGICRTYRGSKTWVKTIGGRANNVKVVLHKESALSPLLFIIFITTLGNAIRRWLGARERNGRGSRGRTGNRESRYSPFTLAVLIRSETGFAPMRAFRLAKSNPDQRTKPVYTKPPPGVVSHRFSLVRVAIASVNAKRTSAESAPNVT